MRTASSISIKHDKSNVKSCVNTLYCYNCNNCRIIRNEETPRAAQRGGLCAQGGGNPWGINRLLSREATISHRLR